MRIRILGSKGRFYDFDEGESGCPWCEAGHAIDWRGATTLHLENDRNGHRTLTINEDDEMECDPYVFFQDG